jgi:hypothetical protein
MGMNRVERVCRRVGEKYRRTSFDEKDDAVATRGLRNRNRNRSFGTDRI